MEIQLLLTATVINLKKLLAKARASCLKNANTFGNVYDFLPQNLFGYWSNSCLWYKLSA